MMSSGMVIQQSGQRPFLGSLSSGLKMVSSSAARPSGGSLLRGGAAAGRGPLRGLITIVWSLGTGARDAPGAGARGGEGVKDDGDGGERNASDARGMDGVDTPG